MFDQFIYTSYFLFTMFTKKIVDNMYSVSKTKVNLFRTSIREYNNPRSATPLIEHYKSRWPEPPQSKALESVVANLPKRTVSESDLKFELRATFDHGRAYLYPHMKFNPADFKVIMKVRFTILNKKTLLIDFFIRFR